MRDEKNQRIVKKHIFKNGLMLLFLPRHQIPRVSLQLFYGVGSNNEKSDERGISHIIEHMIFKGTKKLSESDINALIYKLSGSCNAFTSHDYTGYSFDVPSQNWREVIPVMADCMTNCVFGAEQLNSELKAVVQELKMYNDDYVSTLIEKMITSMFPDHPCHYPIIGHKKDLIGVNREKLVEFYKKHYGPNNGTLVIVGDVDFDEVVEVVEEYFGGIKPLKDYSRKIFYHSRDISSHKVSLYREIEQPFLLLGWEIPGLKSKKSYLLDLISWILGAGKSARLYKKLVIETGLATEVQSFIYDLFDHAVFFVYVQPTDIEKKSKIEELVAREVSELVTGKISDMELKRAKNKVEMDFISMLEDNYKQAYILGRMMLSTGDEHYLMNYCKYPEGKIKGDMEEIFENYLSPVMVHTGETLQISERDKKLWHIFQNISDKEDKRILSKIGREAQIGEPVYTKSVKFKLPKKFDYPRAKILQLKNGLKVLFHDKRDVKKIDCILDLKGKHFYDKVGQQGLNAMMTDLLEEGTKNYSAEEFSRELESYGMELNLVPGQIGISMLSKDAEKGFKLLSEILMHPTFQKNSIERVRSQMISELKVFWDNPQQFTGQLARRAVYKNHPYAQSVMGNIEALEKFSRKDILNAYKKYITPHEARISVVGDLSGFDMEDTLEKTLGHWQGEKIKDVEFPAIVAVKKDLIKYKIDRDQTVLCYAGLSASRFHDDFDPLLLFDQIFTGGVLGAMNSRLFALRESTGIFYSIGGSLVAGATREPGMVYIRTIVSNDRLKEAEREIETVIFRGAKDLTDCELGESQRALTNSIVENFASNSQIAVTFILLDKYELGDDYFERRPKEWSKVQKEKIIKTVARVLDLEKMVKIRVGRV